MPNWPRWKPRPDVARTEGSPGRPRCGGSQLEHQTESLSLKLAQAQEEAAREMEKALRQEKHRLERQQLEFGKTLRQRNEEFERQLKQREQELSLGL